MIHPLEPVYDADSRILILGTMPSPKSRERGIYYGNPQNRFWKVLENVFQKKIPEDWEGRKDFLLEKRIALWDVLRSCEIRGAGDQTIQNPVVNDFSDLFFKASIQRVFTTGKKAESLFKKYCTPVVGYTAYYLPSTSPANQGNYSLEKLAEAYREILPYLE